jgi:hypothetical protein
VASSRVASLTREQIAEAARNFHWNRQMQKWSVVVEGKELPARPLVLHAAGVPPNDSTNSHQAVAILQDRGFEVRYEGKAIAQDGVELRPVSDTLIRSLVGSCEGEDSLLEAWEREHRKER